MDYELFGDLRYDEVDESWTGSTTLRLFATFGAARYEDEAVRRRHERVFPLTVRDPTGKGPSPEQERAYRHLRDNEADVFWAARATLFDCYRAYTASPLSWFWERVGRLLGVRPIESPAGLDTAAGFSGVEVAREHQGGAAYLLFAVNCDWEPEHGMMVVYHKDRPTTWTTADALELESDPFEQ
jgi:hypothetical protein